MKGVIAYSGGIDSTCRALLLLREHPEVEWTLVMVDCGQTSATKQREALDEMLRRHPEFDSYVIPVGLPGNPTMAVPPNNAVLQAPGAIAAMFGYIALAARLLGAEFVYTGYDRWTDEDEAAFDLFRHPNQALAVQVVPIYHFGSTPRSIQQVMNECGVAWQDIDFTVSCAGDPSDPLDPEKVPCGVCPKCIARSEFSEVV